MTEQQLAAKLSKDHSHDRYWIEDEILYESYKTIRGLRYRQVMRVPGLPDMVIVDEKCLTFINKEYSE